jgi:hypothetical protein
MSETRVTLKGRQKMYYADSRWDSPDPAVRARIRGRAITAGLARLVELNRRPAFWVDMESVLAGGPVLYSNSPDNGDLAGTPIPMEPGGYGHWSSPKAALRHVWDTYTPIFRPDHPLRETVP